MKKLITALIIFVVTNAYSQWVQVNGVFGINTYGIIAANNNIFAGVRGNIYKSSDNGSNWISIGTGLQSCYVWSFANSGQNLYVGLYAGDGVYVTSNNGVSWTQMNDGLAHPNVKSLVFVGSNLYAGTSNGGVYLSTSGLGWTPFNTGLTNYIVNSLVSSGTNLFAGTYGGGVFLSTNGSNWTEINGDLNDRKIWKLNLIGTNIFAGTNDSGVFITTNGGLNWTNPNYGLTNKRVLTLTNYGSNIFAGTEGGGVFLSSNNGTSWTNVSTNLSNLVIYSLYIYNGYLYAGTANSLNRRLLSEMIVGVQNISTDIPINYLLHQNYPNPFNPTTKIRFEVILDSRFRGNDKVVLKVFDIMGREVQTLVNERLQPGTYEATFDARRGGSSSLNSGIYFYQMVSGDFKQTRKLILLK